MLLKIIKIIEETLDTKTLRFSLDKNKFEFLPGQFIMLEAKVNGKIERRAYSISSSPTEKNFIEITVKKVENGKVSNYVHSLKEGASLEIKGPYGHFTLDEKAKDIVLIAAGCGVAPFMSMAKYIINKKLDINVKLIYSEKTPEYVICKKEFEDLQKYNNFRYVLTLTRFNEASWKGLKGRVNADLIKKNSTKDSIFYISGSVQMVDGIMELLKEINIHKEKIKIEKY